MTKEALEKLRTTITENLRIQRGGADPITYIDIGNVLNDVSARQNHTIFGRRGCGKSLLLHHSASKLDESIKSVYLNCEDFKNHSYPNVLIEILDALFGELERHLTGWFGRKRRSRELIQKIRQDLAHMRVKEDMREADITRKRSTASKRATNDGAQLNFDDALQLSLADKTSEAQASEFEEHYKIGESKIRELNSWLPQLKAQIRDFFVESSTVKTVFMQIDDFYHLSRADQPLVIDFIHRLCKDLPLYFKLATLRHASTLYVDRGQPIGAQERHDYQPINIDFTFADFQKTVAQNKQIFRAYGKLAKIKDSEIDGLFKGEGFERLVLAGGGVPRDCLSLFLEILPAVQPPEGDGKIGKDDVRTLSRANFERRIEELKQDSDGKEQGTLIKGIYVLREYCVSDKKTNVVLVSEAVLQKNVRIRALLYRLLDYRIIHSAGSAMTHKSQPGTFHAFMIDAGCYAHMRVLDKRFTEIDLNDPEAKERMRSAPVLEESGFDVLWKAAPPDVEQALTVA